MIWLSVLISCSVYLLKLRLNLFFLLSVDLPGIVSGTNVAFLDPHEIYFGRGESGRQFNVKQGLLQPQLYDQFAPFHGIFGCDLASTRSYDNTLFRFPLRITPESQLSKTVYNESMINNLFESLRQEASIILLFLKNVQSISIFKRTNEGGLRCVFKVEVSNATRSQVIMQRQKLLSAATATTSIVEAKFIMEVNITSDTTLDSKKWLVVNRIGSHNKRITELRTKLCLLPWIGLAVPISDESADGRIFCFLPLPPDVDCKTGLPVHVHGYFGLTDNRRGLTWPGMECQNNETAEWNKLLLTEIASSVYCKILEALVTNQPNTGLAEVNRSRVVYSTMPFLKNVQGHWKCILTPMLQQMSNQPVFYSIRITGNSWITLSNGVLDLLHQSTTNPKTREVILKVLYQRHAVITDVPSHVLELIQNYFSSPKVISPAIVRRVLKESEVSVTVKLREQKLDLLRYILSDGNTTEITGIPLLPLANKNFVTFCKHKHSSNPKASVFVSSGINTVDLLPNMSDRFLDESIEEDVKRKLYNIAATKTNVKHSTQLVRLTSHIVTQNIRSSLPSKWLKGNHDKVLWKPGKPNHPPQSWLEAMWNWINLSLPNSLADLEGIPLLPIGNQLGVLSKCSKFIFDLEGMYPNLPTQIRDLLSYCGCTVLTNLPRQIYSHKDISTYVSPPTPSGVLCVLSRISMTVLVQEAAKMITSENRSVYHEFFSGLPNSISSSERDILMRLPLFETIHGTVTAPQQLKAVSANFSLPAGFQLSRDRVVILSTDSYVQKLLNLLNIQVLSLADLLLQYVFPDIPANRYNDQQISVLMPWILERMRIFQSQNQRFVNEMKNLPFVSAQNGTRKPPTELYDPNDVVLRNILNGETDVFPAGIYATSDVIPKLKYLGLKTRETLTASDLLKFAHRIASFSQASPLIAKKVNALFTILNDNPSYLSSYSSNSTLREDLCKLRWIACETKPPPSYPNFVQWYNTTALLLPSDVRSLSKASLIGSSMPTFAVNISIELEQAFGFTRNPPLSHVIKQLKAAIASWKAQQSRSIPGIQVAKFQDMLVEIYCYLSRFPAHNVSTELAKASLTDWIWHGKGFCPPKNIALSTDFTIDLRPQLFLLAKEFRSNETLISFFLQHGVSRKFSHADILGVLDSIRKKHANPDQHTSTEIAQDLTICRAILQWVVKDGKVLPEHLQEKVFVPVQSHSNVLVLEACKNCTYCDRDWLRKGGSELDIPGNYQVIHDSVAPQIARLLGVPALSTCLLSAETLGFAFEQTGPYESITNRIKTVLQEYTEGGIFKELIQNADDACASVVRFIVDWRNGPTEKLLSPDMAASQGPALWAYNNAEFSERDFENINKLAGATKVDEVGKIGRFGLGFNAVYHLTDVPSFVSRQYFVLFDPNVNHIENHIPDKSRPGIRTNLAKNPRPLVAFEDQFQPYHGIFGCNTQNKDATNFNFNGTLFRFPFRTSDEAKKSDICQSVYHTEKVKQIISSFRECSSLLLLFTQHVTQVELYEIENGSGPSDMKMLLSISKQPISTQRSSDPSFSKHPFIEECSNWWRRTLVDLNAQLVTPSRSELFGIVTKRMRSNLLCNQLKTETRETWLVASCGGTDISVSLAAGEGRSRGLLPCGGAAARLNSSVSSDGSAAKPCSKVNPINGEAFCFLPLSISTGLPIHVNGYFAVTSNRRGIWERTTSHQDQEIEVRWNEALLKDALCNAYLQLLNDMKTLQTQDYDFCALWPVYDKLQSVTWGRLVESVYEGIVSKSSRLFYSDGKWLSINQGYILSDELRNVPHVRDALKRLNINVFDIPPQVLSSLIKAGQKNVVLAMDLKMFLEKFLPNIDTFPCNIRDRIICHILDCILSARGRNEFDMLKNYPCITCSQDGKHLAKPCRLINPKGPAACLFSPEDHRFPVGDCYLTDNRMHALKQLGMVNEQISWSEICDRAKSVKAVLTCSGAKALERTRNLIKYLNENIEKLSTKPDPSSISDLRSTEFLPFMSTCPDGYELHWEGSKFNKQKLFAPKDVFLSSEKNLVGSSCVIVDDSEVTGCGKLGHQVKDLLGFFKHPTVQQVIRQLDAAISVNDVNSRNRQTLASVCKKVYKFFENFITHTCRENQYQRVSVYNPNGITPEVKQLLKELSQRSWLFINGNFIPSQKVAYYWTGNGAPYLYSLPHEYRENYGKLLTMAGIRQNFSSVDFINALKSLQETKTGRPLNNDEIKLAVVLATALKEQEIEKPQIGQIPLPDSNNVLYMSGELTIKVPFWLKDRGDARYVHQDIPPQLALDLGAKSLQDRRLKKYSSTIGIPFGQHEKLTDRLKNILKSYPCDSGILKELVQNADDAGATEIHFIWDTRKLPHERVIQYHAEEVQGPALCVYNNKPFTADDLEGIQKLGIGSKADDLEKTGQYGIGFNAVYHLTDFPSFLSNDDTLCFFDPHCRYAPEATPDSPGERFEPVDEEFKEDYKDVLLGYLGEHFNLKGATMFRLPLRTIERSRDSHISSTFLANYKMKDLLDKFKFESKKMLLFLNHVMKISLSEVDKDGQLKETYSVEADLKLENKEKRRELSGIVKSSKHLPTSEVARHEITYELTISDVDNVKETWLVHQCCGPSRQTAKESIPDGRQYGLFPRGGIAAILSPRPSAEYKPQHVAYCFLPLPVYTGLPVHVNGHFALDSSRRNLWHDTDQNSPLTKWNNFMKTSVLAPGYATLICQARQYLPFSQELVKETCRCSFANEGDAKMGLFWYHQLFPTPSKDSLWNILADEVYRYLGSNNLEVLPVVVAADTPVEEETSQQYPNESSSSNDVLHKIRCWLAVKDAYFLEGRGQTKLDEDRLFKLLLRMHFPLLLYSPTTVYFRFVEAKITCSVLEPLKVINFIRTFSVPNSNCQVGNLPIHMKKTNIRTLPEIKVLIDYCKMEEQFPNVLEGLPLLLTADGLLRVFDANNPVYRSKFSDLFPGKANLFVHPDLVYHLPEIKNLPERRVMKALDVHALNEHFPAIFPQHMRNTPEHIPWTYPQNGPLSKKWFQRLWYFLQIHASPKLDDAEVSLSVLGIWPIIPTTEDKLVTIKNGKTVLDATQRSTDAAQGKRIREILEKLKCPILNTEITVKKSANPTPSFFSSTLGRFTFGTSSAASPTDDSIHVTDPHVAQPHNVRDVLQVLEFMRKLDSLDISRLTADDMRTVLSFVQDDLDNLTMQDAAILKKFPFYMGIDRAHFSLSQYSHSALIPPGVPTSEIVQLQLYTKCLFLHPEPAAALHQLYKWLGVGVELSFTEFYRKYIIPRFNIFSRECQIAYLTHIREDVLAIVTSKRKEFTDFLIGSLCIPGEDGVLHHAREFHDPRNEVFEIMLQDNSDHFPPPPFQNPEWLDFLSEIGMKTGVEENQFLEFCKIVAACGSFDREANVAKSKILVDYLLKNEHLRNEAFLCSLSNIKFIASEKVESQLLSLHKQFECNSTEDEPPFVQFFDAVPWKYHVLTWTSTQLLPSWVQLGKELLRYLGVQEVPSVESIVGHLQNLSCTLAEICRRDEVLPQPDLLKQIMESIYKGLNEEIDCGGNEHISDGCSPECKSIGLRLGSIPCVLVEEGKAVVAGNKLSFDNQIDCSFFPFLYTVPRKYGAYEHLMKRLGATEKFTSLQFANVLQAIREKCNNTKMNPDLSEKAKMAMGALFRSLLIENQGGNETKICHLKELFLPSDKEVLVKSNDLIRKISPNIRTALASRTNLNVLFPLEKCDLPREKEQEYFNALPEHLRPKLMDDLFKKVLDPECLNDRCPSGQEDSPCEFISRYMLIIKSPEFQSCLVRLLKHKKNSNQLTEDEQDRLSVFGTDKFEIICMRDIKVHLIDKATDEPLANSSIQYHCYADENHGSWKLYVKHNTGETQAILMSYCIDRISRWIFDSTSLHCISSMLLCKSPSKLRGILDQLNIAEDFSEEELKIGGEVPAVFHYLLQQNPLFIFRAGEIVAYGMDTNETDEEMEDGLMTMTFLLAKVISRVDETDSDDSYDFTAEYLIDLGNRRKKVSVIDLYKFVQNDAPENHITDLIPFTGDPTIMPSSLDEGKREIREALIKAWRLPPKLRQKVIRRLFLRWHPDKNPDNVEFAQEMFKFLLSEIKRMEDEESNIDNSCNFTTLFTGWNRQARRQRDTYSNFRANSGFSTRSTSDYTYPNVSEARRWLKQAKRDLEAAQLLFSSSSQSFDALVCFLSHQVVEKSLKAALYAKCGLTDDQLHTHDVYSLACNVCRLRGSPAEITDMAIVVSNYYLTTRYPNQQPGSIVPADAFGAEQSKRALENASRLLETVETFTA